MSLFLATAGTQGTARYGRRWSHRAYAHLPRTCSSSVQVRTPVLSLPCTAPPAAQALPCSCQHGADACTAGAVCALCANTCAHVPLPCAHVCAAALHRAARCCTGPCGHWCVPVRGGTKASHRQCMVDGTPGTRSSHAQIAYCPVRPAYAGYDAHWRDPLASLQLRTGTFHWLCAALQHEARALCAGRIVFVLEVRPLWPATALVLDVQPLWLATALVLVPPAMGPAWHATPVKTGHRLLGSPVHAPL
jgi:hypothetical protein